MKKAGHDVDRSQIEHLQQIINVGPATEGDFHELGIHNPQQLIGREPWEMFRTLCRKTQTLHDPCVLDVLMASVDFMNGEPPRVWWDFTQQRKQEYGDRLQVFQCRFRKHDD